MVEQTDAPPMTAGPESHAPITGLPRPQRLTVVVAFSRSSARDATGIGFVLHATDRPGRNGPVLSRLSEVHMHVRERAAERLALLRALECARELSFRHLRVRCRDKSTRRHLQEELHGGRRRGPWCTGPDVVGETIRELARGLETLKIAAAPRCRGEARALARAAVEKVPLLGRLAARESPELGESPPWLDDVDEGAWCADEGQEAGDAWEGDAADAIPF